MREAPRSADGGPGVLSPESEALAAWAEARQARLFARLSPSQFCRVSREAPVFSFMPDAAQPPLRGWAYWDRLVRVVARAIALAAQVRRGHVEVISVQTETTRQTKALYVVHRAGIAAWADRHKADLAAWAWPDPAVRLDAFFLFLYAHKMAPRTEPFTAIADLFGDVDNPGRTDVFPHLSFDRLLAEFLLQTGQVDPAFVYRVSPSDASSDVPSDTTE